MKSRPYNLLKSVMQTDFGWSLALKQRPDMQSERAAAFQFSFLNLCIKVLKYCCIFSVLPSILLLIPGKQQAFWNLLSEVCLWMAAGYALIPFSCSPYFFANSDLFCNLEGRAARSKYNSNSLCMTEPGAQGGLDTLYKKTEFTKLLTFLRRGSKQT